MLLRREPGARGEAHLEQDTQQGTAKEGGPDQLQVQLGRDRVTDIQEPHITPEIRRGHLHLTRSLQARCPETRGPEGTLSSYATVNGEFKQRKARLSSTE